MDFWMWWLVGGIVLLILEMFVGTLDMLALGIAAFFTAGLSYILGIDITQWEMASFIFLVSAIAAILVSRLLVLPKVQGVSAPDPMSGEAVVGEVMTVQDVNGKLVVRYEGVYWNIESKDQLVAGDNVRVNAMDDNHLLVEKV